MQYALSFGADSVVPFAVEIITGNLDAGHLLVRDFYLRRIMLTVENASDLKTGLGARIRYQIHNGSVSQQGFAGV